MRNVRSFRPSVDALEVREVPAVLYVSPTGSDANPGTLARPWQKVQTAVNRAAPGDEIVLRGGTYSQGMVRVNTPNLTIRSHDGEWAKITTPYNDSANGMTLWVKPGADNLTLKRVEVAGGYYYAIKAEADSTSGWRPGATGLRVEDSILRDSGRDVVKLAPGADDATFLRTTIYGSGRRDPSNAEGIDNVNADRMVVKDCYIYDIATTGIYPKGGATGSVIEGNLIRNTGVGGVMVGFYTDREWMDKNANPDLYESIGTVVRNNVIVGTKMAGIGMYASKDAVVANNTLVDVAQKAQAAVLLERSSFQKNSNPTFVNNVVVVSTAANRPAFEVRAGALVPGTLTAGNNRYFVPGGAAVYRDVNVSGSTYSGGFAGWQARVGEAGSSEGDPLLTAGYHLRAGSPAVDAGRAVAGLTRDYDGNPRDGAVDIGADEYGAGANLATPPARGTTGTGDRDGAAPAPTPTTNTAPRIGEVAARTIPFGGTTGAVGFTVADSETPAGDLAVTVTSSDPALFPADRLSLGGSGGTRTVTVTAAAGASGTATVTLTVADAGGLTATRTFAVTVSAPVGAASAAFVKSDAATQGNWGGKYGTAGYALAGGKSSLPAGVTLKFAGKSDSTWARSTADVRALENAGAPGRKAATWFSAKTMTLDLDLAGGPARTVSLYMVDWGKYGRTQKVEVVDAATGAVLDSRSSGNFNGGKYLSWTVSGRVQFRVTLAGGGPHALVSGLFID